MMHTQINAAKLKGIKKRFLGIILVIFFITGGLSIYVMAKDTIVVEFWKHDDPATNLAYKEVIPEFESKYPNIKVNFMPIPYNEYIVKILTALASGTGPDVYGVFDPDFPAYLKKGVMGPLDSKVFGYDSTEEMVSQWMEGSLDAFIHNGKLYAIPWEYNTFSIWANVDLFREAGLNSSNPKLFSTWKELGKGAKKLTKFDGKEKMIQAGFQWTYGIDIWYMLLYSPLLWQTGGQILDANMNCVINSSAGVKAMQTWKDLIYKDKVGGPAFSQAFPTEEFAIGKIGMWIAGPWAKSALREVNPNVELAVLNLPHIEGGERKTVLYSWSWVLNSRSKQPKEAMQFINDMSLRQAYWFKTLGHVQPRLGWLDTDLIQEDPYMPIFLEDYDYGSYMVRYDRFSEIAQAVMQAVERCAMNDEDPKASLDIAKREIEASLSN